MRAACCGPVHWRQAADLYRHDEKQLLAGAPLEPAEGVFRVQLTGHGQKSGGYARFCVGQAAQLPDRVPSHEVRLRCTWRAPGVHQAEHATAAAIKLPWKMRHSRYNVKYT